MDKSCFDAKKEALAWAEYYGQQAVLEVSMCHDFHAYLYTKDAAHEAFKAHPELKRDDYDTSFGGDYSFNNPHRLDRFTR